MRFLGTGGPHEGSLSRWRLVCRDDNLHSEGSPCPLLGALPLADRGPAWTVGVRGRADPSLRHCSCIFVLACFLSAPQAARSLTSPSPGAGNSHIPDRVLCPRLKRGRGRLSSPGFPRVARVFPGHRVSRPRGALGPALRPRPFSSAEAVPPLPLRLSGPEPRSHRGRGVRAWGGPWIWKWAQEGQVEICVRS